MRHFKYVASALKKRELKYLSLTLILGLSFRTAEFLYFLVTIW